MTSDPSTDAEALTPVELELWADLASPWSYVGSRHVLLALAHEEPGSVTTRWRALVGSRRPPAGEAGGGLVEAGQAVGIAFDPAALAEPLDSRLAQRAVLLYEGEAAQRAAAAALFAAHFERGLDIADLDVVCAEVAAAAGDDPAELRARLTGGAGEDRLAEDTREATTRGVRVAPTIAVAGRVAARGVRDVGALRRLIAAARVGCQA